MQRVDPGPTDGSNHLPPDRNHQFLPGKRPCQQTNTNAKSLAVIMQQQARALQQRLMTGIWIR
jgi:hypothetical protein